MIDIRMDLGGSGLRFGIPGTGIIMKADSPYQQIKVDSQNADYVTDKEGDIIINSSTNKKFDDKRYVRSECADQYRGYEVYCDNNAAKVLQDVTYVNAIYAIARSLLHYENTDEGDANEVSVTACIPSGEYFDEDTDYCNIFKSCLDGTYTVTFPLLNDKSITFSVSEENIRCTPEGVIAAYAYKAEKEFRSSQTIIVDIGQRSTDITILDKFRPIGRASRSVPIGGMNVEAVLGGLLEKNGWPVSIEDIRIALSTGKIIVGDGEQDVSPFVNRAKKEFAAAVKKEIMSCLANAMMNIRSVSNILPLGRPFSQPESDSVQSLTELLLAEIGTPLRLYLPEDPGMANINQVLLL